LHLNIILCGKKCEINKERERERERERENERKKEKEGKEREKIIKNNLQCE